MASYELEFPEGGVAVVVGNVIAQSADSPNPIVVAYGAESSRWPRTACDGPQHPDQRGLAAGLVYPGVVRQAAAGHPDRHPQQPHRGPGASPVAARRSSGQLPLPGGAIEPESLDFTPPAILRGRVDRRRVGRTAHAPAEFASRRHPAARAAAAWAPGAFQSRGMVTRQPAGR
jgi:hypothetical protein